MLANIIWQRFFSPNSLRHLQHLQENRAKKKNRWENVAAVQEGRKLYFRAAPQKQKTETYSPPFKESPNEIRFQKIALCSFHIHNPTQW